jgi:DNA primase
MTKEDFYILRNSITMRQVVNHYGFRITRKGKNNFIRCPLHASGAERTPSMIIYEGYRGFYCRGCGQGGDVTKFVELYEGVTQKDAALILSERFGVSISENEEVSEETRQKAHTAVKEAQRELIRQKEIRAELAKLGGQIRAYRLITLTAEPFSETWIYIQNKLPLLIGQWEALFGEMKKVD